MANRLSGFRRWERHRQTAVHVPEIPGVDKDDPVLTHVDGQIRWYDENARRTMAMHFRLRGVQLVSAAAIPITQIFGGGLGWRLTAGCLGGLIATCQGFDTMHHYGEHYVAWRATCQQILRERYLFSAQAEVYEGFIPSSQEALHRLAVRVDAIEGQEEQRWQAGQLKISSGAEQPQK